MECVQHPELFLSLQVFFSVIRSSVFANRPLFKFSSYPPTEPGRLGGGVLSSSMLTFQRDGSQVPEKDIPGLQNC